MKRLAISIAVGFGAAPTAGCDRGEDNKTQVPGETLSNTDERPDHDRGGNSSTVQGEVAAAVVTPADAMRYIPDGANLLLGMDSAKVVGSEVLMDSMEFVRQGGAGVMLAAADACNVGMSTWKYAVVGDNTEKEREVVVIMSATGIGKRQTLDCIGTKVTEAESQERFHVGEEDGRVTVSGGSDGEKIYSVSDDVIAMVGTDSQAAFKDLLNGKGRTALEGSLKDTFALVDRNKHIYFGMAATDDMRTGASATLQHVTGGVDLSAGVSVVFSGEFGDSAQASEFSAIANRQFQEMKGMAGAFGVPFGIVESVTIEPKGAAVDISLSAAGDDLRALSELLKAQLDGPRDNATQDQLPH